MIMKDLTTLCRCGSFLLGASSVALVIGIVVAFAYFGFQTRPDLLMASLEKAVMRAEKQSEMTCEEVHLKGRELITKDINHLLDAYKNGSDWRADFTEQVRRINGLADLVEACAGLQRYRVQLGSTVASPITQNILVQVSSLRVFIAMNLKAETCGPACVATNMRMIEVGRNALVAELDRK